MSDDEARILAAAEPIIDEVRPFILSDGGDITLLGVCDGVVRVRMHGACVGCSASVVTLKLGLLRRLKAEVPGVVAIEAVP